MKTSILLFTCCFLYGQVGIGTADSRAELRITTPNNIPALYLEPQENPVGTDSGQIAIIGDQLYVYDQQRVKWLSVQSTLLNYANENGSSNRFLEYVGDVTANGAIMPYYATIVYVTDKGLPSTTPLNKEIQIYINNTMVPNADPPATPGAISVDGVLNTITAGIFFISRTHNIDVNEGQFVRIRVGGGTDIQDIVVLVWVKWRK